MPDVKITIITRSKLAAFKIADGSSAVDAGKWADAHLNDAVALVQAAPKGTDPFAGLSAWAGSR
jgi:hypothetical protein